jgi:hypothetical protein
MKLMKYMSVLTLSGVLAGCGGHGYEGEYEGKAGSSNEFMNALAGSAGSSKIVIGSDFIESQGQRQNFNDIFVRQSGSGKYLVFKDDKSEEAWKILDKKTLMQGNELANVKLVRIN